MTADRRRVESVARYAWPAIVALIFVWCAIVAAPASAAINKQVNFQGRLTDPSGFGVADGTYNVEFKLHNHPTNVGGAQGVCAGSCLWMETRTATKVTVTRGLFAVQLGEITSLAGVNFDQDPVYLSVRVGGTGAIPAWDAEMTPRQRLGASPQAFFADNAGMLGGQLPSYYTTAGNLTGTLADARLSSNVALRNVNNAFSTSQTITGTLTATDITCADCLNAGDLAASAVGTSEIADGAITVADLAFDPATQAELDTHKTSTDHDGRYFTETELNTAGTINAGANPMDWTKLKNVPAAFADGVDSGGFDTDTYRNVIGGLTGTFTGTWVTTNQPTSGAGLVTQINTPNLGTIEWNLDLPSQWALNAQTATFKMLGFWVGDEGSGFSANLEYWDTNTSAWVVVHTFTTEGTYVVANPIPYSNPSRVTKVRINVTSNPTDYFRMHQVELWAHRNPYGYDQTSVAAERLQGEQLSLGADAKLYRSAAGIVRSDGGFSSGGNVTVTAGAGFIGNQAAAQTFQGNYLAGGDTQYAYRARGDGRLEWGPGGSTALDTFLYRDAPAVLRTDGRLKVGGGTAAVTAGLNLKQVANGERGLLITRNTDTAPTGNLLELQNAANSASMFTVDTLGNLVTNGTIASGTAGGKTTLTLTSAAADTGLTIGGDTNLYRSAASILKTDDGLIVAGGLYRPDGAGVAIAPGDGVNRLYGTQEFRDAIGATLNAQIDATGVMKFGTTGDTNLYRSAADTLRTDDTFRAASIYTEPWVAPALLNSWANIGGAYPPAGYFKTADGMVVMRGSVRNGTTNSVFTLPAGYRPLYDMALPVYNWNGGAPVLCEIWIRATGSVDKSGGCSNTELWLNVTFRAEA